MEPRPKEGGGGEGGKETEARLEEREKKSERKKSLRGEGSNDRWAR